MNINHKLLLNPRCNVILEYLFIQFVQMKIHRKVPSNERKKLQTFMYHNGANEGYFVSYVVVRIAQKCSTISIKRRRIR